MAKQVLIGTPARQESVKALKFIADYIKSTLGPAGRPILMTKRNTTDVAPVSVTKDGLHSLQALSFNDPVYDAVLQIAKQSAGRSVIASGDGSTSTIVMAAAFASAIENSTHKNPQAAIRAYRKEVWKAIEAIEKEAVRSEEALRSVVQTSSNRDTEMSDNVLKAISQSSRYGSILVVSNPASPVKFHVGQDLGHHCGRGYNYSEMLACSLDPLANTNEDITLTQPYIVPFNGSVMEVQQMASLLETIFNGHKGGRADVLIIANDVTDKAASEFAVLNRKNVATEGHLGLRVALVKTFTSAEQNASMEQLRDAAAFAGSEIIDGGSLSTVTYSQIGRVGEARLQPSKTYISGKGVNNRIKERAMENEKTAKRALCDLDQGWVEARNASLTGGLVKLTVGGALFSELSEIKDRADDAIKAGQACSRSGALPGCGVSYLRAGKLAGVSAPMQEALSAIHYSILSNYGLEDSFMDDHEKGKTVFVSDEEIRSNVDFLDVGVADSFETVRGVILNAFELGAVVANIGAVCLESNLEMIEKAKLVRDFAI
jgi:chaperonin GroEL